MMMMTWLVVRPRRRRPSPADGGRRGRRRRRRRSTDRVVFFFYFFVVFFASSSSSSKSSTLAALPRPPSIVKHQLQVRSPLAVVLVIVLFYARLIVMYSNLRRAPFRLSGVSRVVRCRGWCPVFRLSAHAMCAMLGGSPPTSSESSSLPSSEFDSGALVVASPSLWPVDQWRQASAFKSED
mmetsp:Transcript_15142/g.60809  ORF Transcript_15142/g.60809 Transcript_15142/m.60809 type:complete len:181 (-) Transcript_15142:37-579(-)